MSHEHLAATSTPAMDQDAPQKLMDRGEKGYVQRSHHPLLSLTLERREILLLGKRIGVANCRSVSIDDRRIDNPYFLLVVFNATSIRGRGKIRGASVGFTSGGITEEEGGERERERERVDKLGLGIERNRRHRCG